jgi:hypothetical protein
MGITEAYQRLGSGLIGKLGKVSLSIYVKIAISKRICYSGEQQGQECTRQRQQHV